MGSFEEEGELQARARARRAVRSMHVHVPTGRAWRLQVGQGADPGVRHLRRVQAPAAILTRATSRPWPLSRNSILELPPTSQSSATAPRIRRSAEPLQFLGPIAGSGSASFRRRRRARVADARSTNQATDGPDTAKRDRLQAATTGDPKPSAPQRPRSGQLTRVNDFTLSQSSCGVALFRVVLVHPARPRPQRAG